MKKFLKFVSFCLVAVFFVWCGTLVADRQFLNENLIRLHVVANSDSDEDQLLKEKVRDVVVNELQAIMEKIPTAEEAKAYILAHIHQLQLLVNRALAAFGSDQTATVSFQRETFDTRHYDTFSLPAGVYESLRIIIGEGEGKNWWCVVFPGLCVPATSDGFEAQAVGSGFENSLTGALKGEQPYQIRFFFLDCLGRLQNFFCGK